MNTKPNIWIVDTSIFLNVLDVPNFNQDRIQVLKDFEERIINNDTFLLPYAAIIETGNHIAQLGGGNKYTYSIKFIEQVKAALNGTAPWKALRFPTFNEVDKWLPDFPSHASKGIGYGDFSIIKEWEIQSESFSVYSVRIWSLDSGLIGYIS